jgi:hypothetical protein
MSFCENKKIILNSREAFLKFRIVDCDFKLSCPQDKMIKNFDFKTSFSIRVWVAENSFWAAGLPPLV